MKSNLDLGVTNFTKNLVFKPTWMIISFSKVKYYDETRNLVLEKEAKSIIIIKITNNDYC